MGTKGEHAWSFDNSFLFDSKDKDTVTIEVDLPPKRSLTGSVKKGSEIKIVVVEGIRSNRYYGRCPSEGCNYETSPSFSRQGAIATVNHHIKNNHRVS